MTIDVALTFINLVTPKAPAKHMLLFDKLASCLIRIKVLKMECLDSVVPSSGRMKNFSRQKWENVLKFVVITF